jgi:hypothetical protein
MSETIKLVVFRVFFTPTLKSEARMPEEEALSLAAECRKRGLTVEVVNG